ncbi:MAG: molecular chaperone DnaK [Candidatus Diapherotrites archaeon]
MAKTIGVDLGTSNSAAAILEGGKPKIIPSAEGASLYGKAFPSVVAFTKDGQLLVGEPAKRQAVTNPEGTITAAKRKMGTNFKYAIGGKEYTPQQISAFILQKIKRDAEEFLGEKVEKAVITVPAYFDDNQRQATKDAGQIAGLEVIRLVNEPTAASLAYGLDKKGKDHKILVFDFGGGTLDVTIMEFGGGVFEVKSTSGDTQLGGTDMDKLLSDYIVAEFKKEQSVDLTKDRMAMQRLAEAAEKAKIELSTVMETDINLPYVTADSNGPKHLAMKITRSKLEQLVEPIIKKCEKPIAQSLADAKLTAGEIDKIILVGGPTRMPVVQKFVEKVVGTKVERGVDPMECVAVGAAIQAGVLSGEVKDVLLLDVTPLSLGIETLGGVLTKLIERNTTIPTKKSQIFTTAADSQTAVDIHILQGERPMANDNRELGRFQLVGIPPAPRGVPQVEVSFDIDANGIVNVTALDKATNKSQSIKIVASQKLSDTEIESMRKAAEAHAEEDKKKKDEIEAINQADAVTYSTDKMLEEFKGKVEQGKLDSVKKANDELKELLGKEPKDAGSIKAKMDELNKLLQAIGSEMYGKAQQGQQQQGESNSGAGSGSEEHKGKHGKGKVVDADFKVEDEGKK